MSDLATAQAQMMDECAIQETGIIMVDQPYWHLDFFTPGKPQTAGSKTAFTNPKTGRAIITESGDRKAKGLWRDDLRAAARDVIEALAAPGPSEPQWSWPTRDPLQVVFTFIRRRPLGHYGSGRNSEVLKPSARIYPVERPDATKTVRAAEDALEGIVWADDAIIVDQRARKSFPDVIGLPRETEGLRVCVRNLARTR